MKICTFIFLCFVCQNGYCQYYSSWDRCDSIKAVSIINKSKIPDNLDSAIIQGYRRLDKQSIENLQRLRLDTMSTYTLGCEIAGYWLLDKSYSPLYLWFKNRGIRCELTMENVIELSLQHYVKTHKIEYDNLVKTVSEKEKKAIGKVYRYKDSIYIMGKYIPKDIKELFASLDGELSDTVKMEVRKNDKDLIEFHMSLGMWIRNRYGLWAGSRIAYYWNNNFNLAIPSSAWDAFIEPDGMSYGMLLAYKKYLNGMPIQSIYKQFAESDHNDEVRVDSLYISDYNLRYKNK